MDPWASVRSEMLSVLGQESISTMTYPTENVKRDENLGVHFITIKF